MANSGEYHSGSGVRTGFIVRPSFGIKAVQYTVRDGLAMFQGDIVLGKVEDVEALTDAIRADARDGSTRALTILPDTDFRWEPNIPFEIDPALPDQGRVTSAIQHWNENTGFEFFRRTSEPDWITFRPGNGCSSSVGRQGGQQFIILAPDCGRGAIIHEIGHAVGFWHEQSRPDRDYFVTILWDNIQDDKKHNFEQITTDVYEFGLYDYDSIMHYGPTAFSKDGVSPTITPTPGHSGEHFGQRNGLSRVDIKASFRLISEQAKAAHDKPYKDYKEVGTDSPEKGSFMDGEGQHKRDQLVRSLAFPAGHGLLPFALAMPHQAPGFFGGPSGARSGVADAVARLSRELQALRAALAGAGAGREALRKQHDEALAALKTLISQQEQSPRR